MPSRLPPQRFEWIDRRREVSLSIEGETIAGFAGDTVSSAILANGKSLLGRSFKYHRARGVLSAANHDVNGMFQSADHCNIRGDVTEAIDGLTLRATNVSGSLDRDHGRFMQWLAPFLPVGFYYKAFHTPKALFPLWENMIRKRAGLGRIRTDWPMQRLPKRYVHTEVLVIGGGPSGMAAATSAAEYGARVLLVDENPHLGGSLDYQFARDQEAADLRATLKRGVTAADRIEVVTRAEASGYYRTHWVPVTTPEGVLKIRAEAIVLATGVFEQPAVFHNNDLPGVMLASAAQRLIARFAVRPCERAVMLVANPEGYRATLDLIDAGVEIAVVADLGNSETRGAWADAVRKRGVSIRDYCTVYEAVAGSERLVGAKICPVDADGRPDVSLSTHLNCDGLLMSVGWAPAAAHLYQAGGEMRYDEAVGQFVPKVLPDGVFAAGRVNGVFDLKDRITDGSAAGMEAAGKALQLTGQASSRPKRARSSHSHPFPIFAHPKGWNFVDFDEDIVLGDLERAADEGFDNIELLKRFSTIGMGPSQGKHANMNGIRVLARKMSMSIDGTGSTTARPFFHPVPLGKLAGRRLRPHRRTPLQAFHQSYNAIFMEAGIWSRPEYYDVSTPRKEAIRQEVQAVRENVGLIDVSTLGKLEIFGPDAPELMDRLYTMRLSNLKVGMSRYALMVDEAGTITDDGVAVRRTDRHYYVTTTTGTSDSAFREIQRRTVEWSLEVEIVNRTGQLGAVNIAGPKSRQLLTSLTDIDLSGEAFPYLAARSGTLCGREALLLRVGFVGELGYEIHMVPEDLIVAVEQIMTAGKELDIRPFGVEAQRLLRLDKGHIIVGQDTDGLTNPYEVNMPWAVHMKKDYFIGKRSLQILKHKRSRSLVAFTLDQGVDGSVLTECNLVIHENEITGRVTSISYSPTMSTVIGMAYVEDEALEDSDCFHIRANDGRLVSANKVPLPFYDPDGLRQKVDVVEKVR